MANSNSTIKMPPSNTPDPNNTPAPEPSPAPTNPAPSTTPPADPAGESLEKKVTFIQKVGHSSKARLAVFAIVFAGIGGAIIYSSFAADVNPLPIPVKKGLNVSQQVAINDRFKLSLPSGWTKDICKQGNTTNVSIGEKLYPSGQTNSKHCNGGGQIFVSSTQLISVIEAPDKNSTTARSMRGAAGSQVTLMNPVTYLQSIADTQVKRGKCNLTETDTKALISGKNGFRTVLDYGSCGKEISYEFYPYTKLNKKHATTRSFYAAYWRAGTDTDQTDKFDQVIQSASVNW